MHVLTGQTIRALDHVIALDLRRLMRNLQGARILHVKCPFSCSVSRILQDIFPWEGSLAVQAGVFSYMEDHEETSKMLQQILFYRQ